MNNKDAKRMMIIAALGYNAMSYRNFIRVNFELWACKLASKQQLLLETVTTSEMIWKWYLKEFEFVEAMFYEANKEFIHAQLDSQALFGVFLTYVDELEDVYPGVLIKKFCNA